MVVRCGNVDMSQLKEVQPSDGTVRLIGSDHQPSLDDIGRVQIFKDNRWGSVCNLGWTDKSSNLVCK